MVSPISRHRRDDMFDAPPGPCIFRNPPGGFGIEKAADMAYHSRDAEPCETATARRTTCSQTSPGRQTPAERLTKSRRPATQASQASGRRKLALWHKPTLAALLSQRAAKPATSLETRPSVPPGSDANARRPFHSLLLRYNLSSTSSLLLSRIVHAHAPHARRRLLRQLPDLEDDRCVARMSKRPRPQLAATHTAGRAPGGGSVP